MSIDYVFSGTPPASSPGTPVLGLDKISNTLYASGQNGWTNLSGGANLSVAGQGFFIGPGLPISNVANTGTAALASSAQAVRAVQFVLPYTITLRAITYAAAVTLALSTITIGIYSADHNTKLIDSGTFDGGSSTAQTKAITPVTLTAGVYWLAWSASSSTTLTGITILNTGTGALNPGFLNNNAVHEGDAANSATAGVLPATLGTIASNTVGNIPACVFET